MAHRCFQGLAQGDDFLMEGAVARRLAAVGNGFLVSVNSVFLDLSRRDLGDAQVPEERDQVNPRSPALAVHMQDIPGEPIGGRMAQRRDGARHIPRAALTGELGFLRRVVSRIFSNLPQRGLHCTGHTLAIPDTTLAVYISLVALPLRHDVRTRVG